MRFDSHKTFVLGDLYIKKEKYMLPFLTNAVITLKPYDLQL